MPTTFTEIFQQVLGLIARAFNSMGDMLGILFVGFLNISPLPDEVDFLLVVLLLGWLISLVVRMIRGK